MSLLRIEKVGRHSLEPGLGGIIQDKGEIIKVGQCGASQGQPLSSTWETLLSDPFLPHRILGCDRHPFTLPFLPVLAYLFFCNPYLPGPGLTRTPNHPIFPLLGPFASLSLLLLCSTIWGTLQLPIMTHYGVVA